MLRLKLFFLTFALIALPVYAQNDAPYNLSDPQPKASTSYTEEELEKLVPPARPEDVSSPEAIVRAIHTSVSGPKGEWNPDRFRSLFIPNALFAFDQEDDKGTVHISTITLDAIINELQKLHRQTGWYEQVADVPMVVQIRRNATDTIAIVNVTGMEATTPEIEHPEKKTSTSTLMYIGKRWWILSHTW